MRTIGRVELLHGLYMFSHTASLAKVVGSVHTSIVHNDSFFDLWHFRLGHPSFKVLHHVSSVFPYVQTQSKGVCEYCHFAKQQKLPFHHCSSCSINSFDLIHVDIWGPLAVTSIRGYSYFLTIVDDHFRHTWVYLMKQVKSKAIVNEFHKSHSHSISYYC